MTDAQPTFSDQPAQRHQLRTLFTWLFRLGLVVAFPSLILAVGWQRERFLNVAIIFAVAGGFYVARWLLDRGRLRAAIVTFYLLLMAAAIAGMAVAEIPTSGLAMLLLIPILAIAVVVPYTESATLRLLMAGGWLVSLGLVVYAHILINPEGLLEALLDNVILIMLIGFMDGFIFTLLWQFRARLAGMVARLQAAQATLEAQVLERTADLETSLHISEQLQLVEMEQRQRLEQATEQLEQRIAAEQAAQAEAQRLRQIEAENRQRLEQAVSEYLAFAQLIARGDLTQRLQVGADGALGQLGAGLNAMVESLQQLTGQVQRASTQLAATAANILAAMTEQAAVAAEQAAAITQTSTTIEEVKAIASQTADQAEQMTSTSRSALDVARQGTQVVEDAVNGMETIRQQVSSIAETILELSEQNQTISSIIQTVSELADQSNLLALNAAIEAARAGEQGKSFAIVAQHVRELAERSKLATSQVREILGEIQQVTGRAVFAAEEGSKGVEEGARRAAQAGQVIHRITDQVETGARVTLQVAAAAQQQTTGMEQIGQAMQSISRATSQALATTRATESAAQALNSLAQSLQQAIASYRL